MEVNKEPIIVKYRKKQHECRCCGRPFTESEIGELREFKVTIKGLFEWADWTGLEDLENIYEEDLGETVCEWLYDTIYFYACSIEDSLIIDKSEGERIVEIIKQEIKRLKANNSI